MYHCLTDNRQRQRRQRLGALGVLLLVLLAGCASQEAMRNGEDAFERGNWDEAVFYYLQALAEDPTDVHNRMQLIRARQRAAQEHFKRGTTLQQLGQLQGAREELLLATQLDPTHQIAEQELRKVQRDLDILAGPDGERTLEENQAAGERGQGQAADPRPPVRRADHPQLPQAEAGQGNLPGARQGVRVQRAVRPEAA